MGYYHSTYFAYGFQIADVHPNDLADLDTQLAHHSEQHGGDVGYLHAGNYDADMTFLVTHSTEVRLGTFDVVTPHSYLPEQYDAWNKTLHAAAAALGIPPREPGWLVVPDLS